MKNDVVQASYSMADLSAASSDNSRQPLRQEVKLAQTMSVFNLRQLSTDGIVTLPVACYIINATGINIVCVTDT